MAAIVLDSNLIPNTQLGTGYGALPYAIPDEERGEVVTNEDGTVTVPTYQLQSNVPTFDLSEMQKNLRLKVHADVPLDFSKANWNSNF